MYLPLWIIIGKSMLPPPKWIVGEVSGGGEWEGGGGTSRGVMCWLWLLAVVLACTGTLVKPEGAGPIYAAVGTCLSSS